MKKLKVPKLEPDNIGFHNAGLDKSIDRLTRGQTFRDLSTIWITPTRGSLKPKVFSCWFGVQRPMNQPFIGPIFIENEEVGVAYEKAFEMILDNPELSKWKYVLTVEEDNLPPSDGLINLYEGMKEYDCVGGLYWTKGEGGQPMIYGNPAVMPMNFVPQVPQINTIQRCNGLGMGFSLFKIDMFKKLPRPWFRTVQEKNKQFTQDLWFFNNASKAGFKFACDTRVKVGHLDVNTGMVW